MIHREAADRTVKRLGIAWIHPTPLPSNANQVAVVVEKFRDDSTDSPTDSTGDRWPFDDLRAGFYDRRECSAQPPKIGTVKSASVRFWLKVDSPQWLILGPLYPQNRTFRRSLTIAVRKIFLVSALPPKADASGIRCGSPACAVTACAVNSRL